MAITVKRGRSAITGRFVSLKTAARNPRTTIVQTIRVRVRVSRRRR